MTKLRTLHELVELLGDMPRKKTVVLCHGVFDIVHPGHIRHLEYAKSKADILVASITSDLYVNKALYRPFVPQELRAKNLAVLEMVDYVMIDNNMTPLQTLTRLQPDFFAKGFEYQAAGLSEKTQEEQDVVELYGGEMLFTPGDVVYASSVLPRPDLKLDKLHALMADARLTYSDLRKILTKFAELSIHVVGDTIIDTITKTSLIGSGGKTPTLSVHYHDDTSYLGGAAIVAGHMAAAGAVVNFSTFLGSDQAGLSAAKQLGAQDNPVIVHLFTERARPTTHKNVIVCDGYRLLKVDTLDNRSVSDENLKELCTVISNTPADAVVFSDFRHGIFNQHTLPALIKAIPSTAMRVADSQVASRWGNILDYSGFHLITPNEREARFALGDQDTGVLPLVEKLIDTAQCDNVIMKLGEHGAVACENLAMLGSNGERHRFSVLDSFARTVVDPVGAGDALLAYATLSFAASGSLRAALILGSIAAALTCEVDGNLPVGHAAVATRLEELEQCASLS